MGTQTQSPPNASPPRPGLNETPAPHTPHVGEGSLITPEELSAIGARERTNETGKTRPRPRWIDRADRELRRSVQQWWSRRRLRWASLAMLAFIAGVWAFVALRPAPAPNYATAPMDDVLEFTLLEDDFNDLPVDKRLDLLRQLIERVKTMGSSDSVLMAAFAASIEGDLREQMMKNATKLVVDVWDKFAVDYVGVPPEERPEFLDQKYLELVRMMETLAGEQSDKTDEELLKEAREQAERDEDMMGSSRGPDAGAMAGMASFLRNGLGEHAAPQQQLRGQQLMRDMTRHFRGRDVDTGKRK